MKPLKFTRIGGAFAICRLAPDASVPAWPLSQGFFSITRNADELSIVCPETNVPFDVRSDGGWVCLKIEGPFAFSETGILESFIRPLSDSGISIFAISTFDTDYVLVREASLDSAIQVLQQAGHVMLSEV